MRPQCIVLDEPTAMLDPNGRKEVLEAVHQLNRQENVTVVLITHYMEEVIDADQVVVMDDGHVVMEGTPREIFSQVETLKKYRLDVPQVTLLAHELKQSGVDIPDGILDYGRVGKCLMSIELKNVTYTYSPGTSYEIHALKGYQSGDSGWTVYWCDRTYRQWKVHTDPASECTDPADFRNSFLQWRRCMGREL